jgi:large subunit ribosomal protein L15
MEQYQLKKPDCIKDKKRVGRGTSSGHGKTCCRGQKGQLSRAGSGKKLGFEGGQMPLQRRIPKRGFNNVFRKQYQVVNLVQIADINSNDITPEILVQNNIIKNAGKLIKILGTGDLKKSIKITADAFSATASKSIETAGGQALIRQLNKKQA